VLTVNEMMTEMCQDLRNWFDRGQYPGRYVISGGAFTAPFLVDGQYYRIVGSIFNDGIHQYGHEEANELTDEAFEGSVWALAIPRQFVADAAEIAAWQEKYETANSAAMSPYMSESFGGYSYQKGSALTSKDTGGGVGWRSTFASKLNMWRKL